MNAKYSDTVVIARELIHCPSVTPKEAGALSYLQSILEPIGFKIQRLEFREENTQSVENLYASIGTGSPHLVFAGHTDVVPPGSESDWTFNPFEGVIENGVLYGRGAVDMKGAIAAFANASKTFLSSCSSEFDGKLSFLITGDEEGPAINGTKKLLEWCDQNGEKFDACLVGEPTNPHRMGEAIKIGRRGSLSANLSVFGKQGHVAYSNLSHNPIPDMIDLASVLTSENFDMGSELFQPSNLEVTTIDSGNPTRNITPESISAHFNIRFNDKWTRDSLKSHITEILQQKANQIEANFNLEFIEDGSDCFFTRNQELISKLSGAIQHVTGQVPELSTGGGTSDARFIKDYCPVVEFGLVNQTIHQVDERVPLSDLELLYQTYLQFLKNYYGQLH